MEKPNEIKEDNINYEKISEFFPKTNFEGILRITDIGMYSITKKNEAYFITNLILKYFGENKIIITDSTACCGGNTISFMLHNQIEKVNTVEIDNLHFDILKNNVYLFKNSEKVHFYNDNFLHICHKLVQDVIFYDLPWGGRSYIDSKELKLGLENEEGEMIDISKIINMMKVNSKLQVLKLPLNFDFTSFFQNIIYTKIKIHKIYNKFNKKLCYYIVILIT